MTLSVVFVMAAAIAEPSAPAAPDPPAAVLQELLSRGCKLPGKRSKGAIITGEVFKRGQSDWAALCFGKKSASLLVFPEGSRERVALLEMMPREDSKWSISVLSQEQLNSLKSSWGEKGPAVLRELDQIDHQGISSFVESGDKDARCLYCYSAEGRTHYHDQDKWLVLMTIDIN